MSITGRMSNGWQLALSCIKVLNANKQLVIFPILSGLSLALITISFFAMNPFAMNGGAFLLFGVLYYIASYFVIVFFNMALIHCAKLYFDGEQTSILKGLQFSASRVRVIFLWAVFAATVGILLKILQDNLGWLGKLVIAAVGIVWSVATFLVVPVLAYEDLSPTEAVKRSAQLMKEKWGEGISANFSFAIIFLIPFVIFAILASGLSAYNDGISVMLFVAGGLFFLIIASSLQSILISALYSSLSGNNNLPFKQEALDNTFIQR